MERYYLASKISMYWLILSTFRHAFGNEEHFNNLIVPLGEESILHCHKSPKAPGNWKRGDETLYINRILTNADYRNDFVLLDDYSLKITSVNVKTEGIYKCNVDTETFQAYKIEVEGLSIESILICQKHMSFKFYKL